MKNSIREYSRQSNESITFLRSIKLILFRLIKKAARIRHIEEGVLTRGIAVYLSAPLWGVGWSSLNSEYPQAYMQAISYTLGASVHLIFASKIDSYTAPLSEMGGVAGGREQLLKLKIKFW